MSDGREKLTASVKDTLELRRWLLGFGDEVEVVAPEGLREEFVQIAQDMLRRYQA